MIRAWNHTKTRSSINIMVVMLAIVTSLLMPSSAYGSYELDPVFMDMDDANYADVQAEAYFQTATANKPRYSNVPVTTNPPEHQTFNGYFTPSSPNGSLMAIFSDDGCNVWVTPSGGTEQLVLNKIDQGQALPNLDELTPPSLIRLPSSIVNNQPVYEWSAGVTYQIKIEYSNIIYTGSLDIDGCTLFAYEGGGSISSDQRAPTGSISIDGGASYTSDLDVTLGLSATDSFVIIDAMSRSVEYTGLYQMQLSNDGTNWSPWERYTTTRNNWQLSAGDGTKTVYVKYKDNGGNVSQVYSDTIILRTGAKIIHVDSNASDDSGDGFTWETAKKTVQGALDAAFSDDQVWVKTGTYNESITMPNGVALYGGFTGTEDQRSPKVNVTTIDGGSAYRTIFVSDTSAIIDGFTIAGDCIGVYCSLGDCTISNNNIIADDAGIYSDICNVSILNNTVTATDGNGIYCYSGNSVVVNNLVMDCGSVGVWTTSYGCASDIVNNTLIANSVGLRIDVFGNSNITVTNNIIAFNSSYGINYNYYGGNTPPTLSHNCVSGNGSGGTDNYYNISAGTGDRSDDPLFIDRENIDHNLRNYHLRADSPCIDTGTSQDAPSTDLDGNSRPINGNFDIGAYEFSDFTHPSVLVTSATSQTNVGPIVFTVTFSEPVTGFNDTANDVIVDGTAGVLSANISPTSDPAVYTVSVSGMTTDGYVTLSVPADVATDAVGNDNTASTDPVATVAYNYTFDTISAAATCADGTLVRLYGKRVTAVFPDCLYVQDVTADSNFGVRGIRVYYSGQLGVGVGQSVDASGTMGTTGSERCITGASVNIANSIRQPLCVYAMINRTVGGGNWKYDATTGKGQRGITGAYGWNNIGLLVKSWGKVTAVDTSSFTISDGSTSFDGTSSISVKVITAPENIPALNSYVAVMGISSCEESGSDLISVIRVRSSSDIQTLQAETVTLQLLQSDYNFIGIPALPADPSPGAIFNVPNMSLVRLEPITQTEISWPNDSTVFGNILLGEGYRVSSPSACSIQYSGYKINLLKTVGYRTAAAISLPGYPEVHAGPIGYHRVANPFDYNINLSSGSELFLTDGESMKAWSTAASSGWCDIMMYGCNPSTGINYTVSYLSMAQEHSLNARSGYDFYTNINNLALIIPEVDTTGPSVSVSAADGQANPSNTSPIRFTVEFSEPVFDFDDNGDVTIGGTAGASSASITDSGDHKTYTVAVSGMTSNGTVTLIVNAGAATDANSNNNTASTDPIATVAYNGIGDALPIITILSPIGTTDDIAPVVTWSASGQFTQYQVYIENIADANDFWDSGDVVGSSSAVQVTKLLNNGSTYSLKARVYGAGGWGPWSDTVQFTVNFVEPPLPTSVLYCQQ